MYTVLCVDNISAPQNNKFMIIFLYMPNTVITKSLLNIICSKYIYKI